MAAVEVPQTLEYRGGQLNVAPVLESPFQPKLLHSSEHKLEPRHTKDFKAKYNKVKAKLAFLNSSASASSSSSGKNKVKALMALADEERVSVGKESARNGEWIKISMKKVHTLLEMEDNDDRKSFLDYMCIDLNYVEEQRNNLMSKHRNLVQELNTCKEQLLVLKQVKLDLLTMQHVNTDILKENQNLRNKLKELTYITEAWLNSFNKVNQCTSKQILTQKKKILGIEQLTKDTSSSGPKDLVFVKSLADKSKVSITSSYKPKLSKTEDSTLSNHETTHVRGNKSSSVSNTNSAPASKLKNVKMEDDPPLAIVMKELNELKLQISKNKSSYFRNKNSQQDFQDSPDDEEDTRSSQKFSSAKAIGQTECHKCSKNDHFARDCWSKTSFPSYQSPFQPKLLHSSEQKPEPRHTKDFKAKYNKVKAKLALLNSSGSAPSSSSGKTKV
ncbi:retrovirus-related pol polyprotein from transposon TNT 1-94 [Tanacetum coccineum]